MTTTNLQDRHHQELLSGDRFDFGNNWASFLGRLNEERIDESIRDLQMMLKIETLEGKSFLDVGSGSGLSSLSAKKLGATVQSFDYDPNSVGCTAKLKERFYPNDPSWNIEHGSVLDTDYMKSLGQFDIVYSWGVLHHTGDMATALANVVDNVKPGGHLFIALYNDQGRKSRWWTRVKKLYVTLPAALRYVIVVPAMVRLWAPSIIRDTLLGNPTKTWRNYTKGRGMSPFHDVVDWVGGYPFEVSKPEEIFSYFRDKGFTLTELKTCAGGIGCNQFVFMRTN